MADKLTDEERELLAKHREKKRAAGGGHQGARFDLGDDKAVKRAQRLGILPADLDESDEDSDEDEDEDEDSDDTPRRRGFFD